MAERRGRDWHITPAEFKERGVEFSSDFRDLGYIEYEKDSLSAKSMELLRELIKLRAVKVTPGA